MLDIIPPRVIFLLFTILTISTCTYIPQLLLSTTPDFLNHQIIQQGPAIQQLIKNATIPPIQYNDTYSGVKLYFKLTNITQDLSVKWNSNVLNVTDHHNFTVLSKNINITLKAHIQFKIGIALKQKGTLDINITKLEADTMLKITQPHCASLYDNNNNLNDNKHGLGFDIQIQQLFTRSDINIKIQGKSVDNLVIEAVIFVLKNRLPSIINNLALTQINPLITKYTCIGIEQTLAVGQQQYVVIANTTQLPYFSMEKNNSLYLYVDVTLKNQRTNQTNDQVQDDKMDQNQSFRTSTNITASISSNMINTLLWLVDDSNVLHQNVTNQLLNTETASILIPSLNKKWPSRPMILLVSPSNKLSHVYFRNGKLILAISVSVQLIVNVTGNPKQTVTECLQQKSCVIGVNLNTTALLSIAPKIKTGSILTGLINSISIEMIEVIEKDKDIKIQTESLKETLSILISAYRPQINKILQDGYPLDLSILKDYGVTGVMMDVFRDYAIIGARIDDVKSQQLN